MIERERMRQIILEFKNDPESVYNTWFINNETRLKGFRAIRRGIEQVIQEIKEGVFPNDFKGSSLEIVLTAITEQKQVFQGAAHPFYWKPKLRIPDIYEDGNNKKIFGRFLESCIKANREDQIIGEIIKLSKHNIKGLGPSVANILYFIHPTILPPFNTAMLNGFNLLFKEKKKLGSWESYLEMRDTLLRVNEVHKDVLSNDLGALSGLVFDIGAGNIFIDENAGTIIENQEKKEKSQKTRRKEIEEDIKEENDHTKIQYMILNIGRSLGYDVIAASNDRGREYKGEKFSFISLGSLPAMDVEEDVLKTIDLIDVLWLEKGSSKIVCAFEVEKSTSIYSGILRLTDLALTLPHLQKLSLYLIAPDKRENEIKAQLKRPSLGGNNIKISYILFSDLCEHCDSICKLGDDCTIMEKISKQIN